MLNYPSPLYNPFIRPHHEHAIKAPPPILSRDAGTFETAQKLSIKFMKELPYGAALQQHRLYSLACWRTCGECLISPMTFWNSLRSQPSPIPSVKVFTSKDTIRAITNTHSAFIFWNEGMSCFHAVRPCHAATRAKINMSAFINKAPWVCRPQPL